LASKKLVHVFSIQLCGPNIYQRMFSGAFIRPDVNFQNCTPILHQA